MGISSSDQINDQDIFRRIERLVIIGFIIGGVVIGGILCVVALSVFTDNIEDVRFYSILCLVALIVPIVIIRTQVKKYRRMLNERKKERL